MRIGKELQSTPATEKNRETNLQLLAGIEEVAAKTRLGGGAKAIEKLHGKGKLSARERIQLLIDPGSDFLEIGLHTAFGFYEEEGGAPSASVVAGVGLVEGRLCMVVANDATVKAGAWFPLTAKKNMRAQKLLSRTVCRQSTLLILPVCSCQCRMKSFRIRSILADSSGTTLLCPAWAFRKFPASWGHAWLAGHICL